MKNKGFANHWQLLATKHGTLNPNNKGGQSDATRI
jgi:hypothetical protein